MCVCESEGKRETEREEEEEGEFFFRPENAKEKGRRKKNHLPSSDDAGTASECADLNTSLLPWNCFLPPRASSGLYHQIRWTSTDSGSTPRTSAGLVVTAAAAAAAALAAEEVEDLEDAWAEVPWEALDAAAAASAAAFSMELDGILNSTILPIFFFGWGWGWGWGTW